jgi:hypothetical protein
MTPTPAISTSMLGKLEVHVYIVLFTGDRHEIPSQRLVPFKNTIDFVTDENNKGFLYKYARLINPEMNAYIPGIHSNHTRHSRT